MHTFHGAPIHVLQQDLDFAIVVEHVMAFDHIRVVHAAEDLNFDVDLVKHWVLVGLVYDLEGEDAARPLVDHLIHGPTGVAPNLIGSLELGVVEA